MRCSGNDCRSCAIIDTADQIQDTGTVEALFHGNLHFKDVHFSYIPDEEVIKESI
jgi:hypothetical protein